MDRAQKTEHKCQADTSFAKLCSARRRVTISGEATLVYERVHNWLSTVMYMMTEKVRTKYFLELALISALS